MTMQPQQTMTMKELWQSIVDQTNASLSLAGHAISAHAKQTNFVFSPLSINVLLGLVASVSAGPARNQILSFLTSSKSLAQLHALFSQSVSRVLADGSPVGGPVLSCANGLWVDRSLNLKPEYRHIVKNVYRAAFERVDFQNKANEVREEVNAWAEKETRGLIKDLLAEGDVNAATELILANAVYFKGAWETKFDAHLTNERRFYLLDGSSVEAPMMGSFKNQYVECFDGFKVLKLPYKRGEDTRSFSMCIYLPDAKDGLAELAERVCSESGFIDNHLPHYLEKVDDFGIPKFKFDFGFKVSDVLAELGIYSPAGIIQKSYVEVDEEGTEAAAVTVALLGSSPFQVERRRLEFVADHPFLFVIREDKTGLILFIGLLFNPLST